MRGAGRSFCGGGDVKAALCAAICGADSWTDATKTVQLFHMALTYLVGGELSTQVLTRISDGATLTRTFSYAAGQLAAVTRS